MGLKESTQKKSENAWKTPTKGQTFRRQKSAPAEGSSKRQRNGGVGTPQAVDDETARVAVLPDGSCSFFKIRRSSLPPDYSASLYPTLVEDQQEDCHYTCHQQCHGLVTLDCRGDMASSESKEETQVGLEEMQDPDQDQMLIEDEESSGWKISREELQQYILEYNASNPSGLDMTLEKDGSTFRGFIRVHMNLSRPISVVAGTRPPSIYDILKDDETMEKTLTSFYLPRDTVKALHVTSETTTHEVIKGLLKKFKVVDNPGKFALYERYYEQGETAKVKMRRISENEKPLVLALKWSREVNCNKMFVLQENDTGDILWDAFSLPELNNFLRILDREEEEYKKMVMYKYEVIGRKIQEAMERLRPSTPSKVPQHDAHHSGS